MTFKVLICDDEQYVAVGWLNDLNGIAPEDTYEFLPPPSANEIKDGIRALLARRTALSGGGSPAPIACLFDEADILILDYDLLHVDESNTRYTGEGVARLARTFSKCGVIIVLNQYLETQFDLGMRGHVESFADLNIDADLIAKSGLWVREKSGDFRPSHWPVLSDAAASFKRRVSWLLEGNNFQSSVTKTLGMTPENSGKLSDTAFGFLAPGATSFEGLEAISFEDFVGRNSAAVDTRDGHKLIELDRDAAARLAASRIKKWIDREVLGPQDVLVDIPHLLQRAPYLMGGTSELESWNDAAQGNKELVKHIPEDAWFVATDWVLRPALWWSTIEADQGVRDVRATFDYSIAPDFVFAEDSSIFIPIGDATEFRAGFHNQYDRRYLKFFQEIRYSPQRRFAFGS